MNFVSLKITAARPCWFVRAFCYFDSNYIHKGVELPVGLNVSCLDLVFIASCLLFLQSYS